MAVTIEQVRHIAKLSNLEFTQEELETFVPQFSKILEHIEQLGQVNTDGIEPTYHAVATRIDSKNSRRDDVRPSFFQEEALANAPDADQGQFRVPKVIK